jgi:catechol 2,3-dioxygenase-like lactoylglutathione lyase family enzyme
MLGVRASGIDAKLTECEPAGDRIVVIFELRDTTGEEVADAEPRPHVQVAFVVDAQIIELQDAHDRAGALVARPTAPPPSPLGPRSGIGSAAAIFPVRDLDAALEHYRQLGFAVHAYEGGGYGFVRRGPVELHLGEHPDLGPARSFCAVYLMVADADALAAEWRSASVNGRLEDVIDTDYGMREGAYVDPDGNRIRFGSPREN